MGDQNKKALFVCLGNICRSPIAEAVFADCVRQLGKTDQWTVDSAAIGDWHVGRKPDTRALQTMRKHQLPYDNVAQQLKAKHFTEFDYIFGMDTENMADMRDMQPKGATARLLMLGDFDPTGDRIIRDPYYEPGTELFEKCYVQCERSCKAFLQKFYNNEKI